MNNYYSEYSKVLVAVDCIIFGFEDNKLKILIGHRKIEPGYGQWSLYGGFMREDESIDNAAYRTLEELTGMKGVYMRQVGAFGKVDRDPGERVISIAYYALIKVTDYDDNLRKKHEVEWVDIDKLPLLYSDHNEMVKKALFQMQELIRTEPISFNLLPELFTLTQLQNLCEAVYGQELDKRNFRKRVKEMTFIETTGLIDKRGSKRGAALYRFNMNVYNTNRHFRL